MIDRYQNLSLFGQVFLPLYSIPYRDTNLYTAIARAGAAHRLRDRSILLSQLGIGRGGVGSPASPTLLKLNTRCEKRTSAKRKDTHKKIHTTMVMLQNVNFERIFRADGLARFA